MNNTKHTPGPWNALYHPAINGDTIEVKQYPNELEIRYANSETKSRAEANARLIAAAPDMLEALDLVYRDLTAAGDNADAEQLRVVQAAIAKARGQ